MIVSLNLNQNKQQNYRNYQTKSIKNNQKNFGTAYPSDGDYLAANNYNKKLIAYIQKNKLVAFLGDIFKSDLLIPVQNHLEKEGLLIQTKLTKTPPMNATESSTQYLDLYEAYPEITDLARREEIKNAAASAVIISQMEPNSFVDYTPNLAKFLLLKKLSPIIQDNSITEKIQLMNKTVVSIEKAIQYEDPYGLFPQDIQYVYEHLIPVD